MSSSICFLICEILRYFYASTGSESITSEYKPDTHVHEEPSGSVPLHIIPILGVRYTAEGHWLVYRVEPVSQYLVDQIYWIWAKDTFNQPPLAPTDINMAPDNCPGDADNTLVDVSRDMVPSG